MKKVICCIVAFCILINCSFFGTNADSLDVQENADYVKFNLDDESMTYHSFDDLPNAAGNTDGASLPGYFPNGIEYIEDSSASTYAIVGSEDSRAPVSSTTIGPYCNTVFIRAYYEYNGVTYVSCGSGFMIGPSAVGTAAHCIHDGNYGLADRIEVIPAKHGTLEPYGKETVDTSANGSSVVIPTTFINTRSSEYDWAVIKIDTPLGNQTGWLGLKWQSGTYNGTYVYNTGYPDTVYNQYTQNSNNRKMYLGTGLIRDSETRYLYGDFDATSGNSGGPVFAYYSNTGYTLIGILTAGSSANTNYNDYGSSGDGANSGVTRITQDVYNVFALFR